MSKMLEPVCLIRCIGEDLLVEEDTLQLLSTLNEAIAVICLAGQYRTGKSFFLNQLARLHPADPVPENGVNKTVGFQVGSTTESCTRGVWIWDPIPSVRNAKGERVIFMDTEGLAATDNDETFDAKIFSLGLLLSSLFVFNTMGVIDETAIDRLFLVSELTKHVCVSTTDTNTPGNPTRNDETNEEDEDTIVRPIDLAPHFPPFVWLLRDFVLELKRKDGSVMTPNEYLEKQLELKPGESHRIQERNNIRVNIQALFSRRECFTLVRPVLNEAKLRLASTLPEAELRPEFVKQMTHIKSHLLSVVAPKQLYGQVMNGKKLAFLVKCYVNTLNSGSIPDIKAAWQYVTEASCQSALMQATACYDSMMSQLVDIEEFEAQSGSICSLQEFETAHRDAQEKALEIYKTHSVEGSMRRSYFQKLKQHIQKQKNILMTTLQHRSNQFCIEKLTNLKSTVLESFVEDAKFKAMLSEIDSHQGESHQYLLAELLDRVEDAYNAEAKGPAKKHVFYQFMRQDFISFCQKLLCLCLKHAQDLISEERANRMILMETHEKKECELNYQLHEKEQEIRHHIDTEGQIKENVTLHIEKIKALEVKLQNHKEKASQDEDNRRQLKTEVEQAQRKLMEMEKDIEKLQLQLTNKSDTLTEYRTEIKALKESTADMRTSHEQEKETWIRKVAEQDANIASTAKTIHQLESAIHDRDLTVTYMRALAEAKNEKILEMKQQLDSNDIERVALNAQVLDLERQYEACTVRELNLQDEVHKIRRDLESSNERFEHEITQLHHERQVQETLEQCISEVVRHSDAEKVRVLQEERTGLQEQLGELLLKVTSLPDFYQRHIFCSADPAPDFFDALTS
uniref:Guanylatebinding protein putative n=1 Tax=Albugo laibachii Nc14 TaxID=890382 RepID=F0WFF0_9STRA|nr:guanylatebinding protein putative [Albugo laibachii Nc14]|eukprot:CCA19932.1 guanylatebinding protein putative [Albugo laibachii Nc14]